MQALIIEPTAQSTWHRLITEAAERTEQTLDEARESYLVFLLMRYLQRPDMVKTVMALHFLKGMNKTGQLRENQLQEVGDQCLLFAGLFPEQADKRLVTIDYFVKLGRSAYSVIADTTTKGCASLYQGLADTFVSLADILHATRAQPDSMLAMVERYTRTGSTYAKAQIDNEGLAVMPTPSRYQH